MTELQRAIETLYDVFARYQKPAKIDFCPCGCTKPDGVAPLLAAPLREVRSSDLRNYAFSAMSTQGSLDDFRYFLPRLLQGIVEDISGIDPEILFGKLSYKEANWTTWPEPEVNAIKEYLAVFWRTALSVYPIQNAMATMFEIESVLSCIAQTGEPLEPYLEIWSVTKIIAADENLIQFVTMNGERFSGGGTLDYAFWEKWPSQGVELRRWLLRPDTMQRITDSAHLLRADGWEDMFEPALAILKKETTESDPMM